MESLASPAEVAEYLDVKPQTLRLWASQGKGPAYVMIEGRRKYLWEDIRAYVKARKVTR